MKYEGIVGERKSDSACITTTWFNGKRTTTAVCAHCSWGQGRTWEVEQNAITKLAEHLMIAHKVRLTLPKAAYTVKTK